MKKDWSIIVILLISFFLLLTGYSFFPGQKILFALSGEEIYRGSNNYVEVENIAGYATVYKTVRSIHMRDDCYEFYFEDYKMKSVPMADIQEIKVVTLVNEHRDK